MTEFSAVIYPGEEAGAFDDMAHALQEWARQQDDYEDDDSDATVAEASAEAFCTCHGGWPRSDAALDALANLREQGCYHEAFDNGFTVFEIRYTEGPE